MYRFWGGMRLLAVTYAPMVPPGTAELQKTPGFSVLRDYIVMSQIRPLRRFLLAVILTGSITMSSWATMRVSVSIFYPIPFGRENGPMGRCRMECTQTSNLYNKINKSRTGIFPVRLFCVFSLFLQRRAV